MDQVGHYLLHPLGVGQQRRQVGRQGNGQSQAGPLGLGAQALDRPIVAGSARNRFPGIVTRIEKAAVLRSLENLMTFPFVKNLADEGKLQLHGAYFGVAEGSLSIVDRATKEFSRVYQSSLAS